MKKALLIGAGLLTLTFTGSAFAFGDDSVTMEDIVVKAPRVEKSDVSLKPEALPANVTVVTGEELKNQQVVHYLDMLRQVPGMGLETYGQGAIGDAIGMRGFFSDHGSQTAIFVDGVPLNWANSNHANGLIDISWLTPEMIDRIEVIKGPFSPLYGSFNLGGTVNIITKKTDTESQVNGYGGTYGTYRGAAELTTQAGSVTPFFVEEGFHQDGWRQNDEWSRLNSFNKVSVPVGNTLMSLRAGFVKQDWNAPGYINLQAAERGDIPRNDDINPSDGGDSRNANLVATFEPKKGEGGLHGTLYVTKENQDRFSTFEGGSQKWGLNDHVTSGWRGIYNFEPMSSLALALGTDGQYADGRAASYKTIDRNIQSTNSEYTYRQWTGSLFGQFQMKPLAWFDATTGQANKLKLVGGARYDVIDIDIVNKTISDPSYSGTARTTVTSPKAGVVVSPVKTLDFFANVGVGFRQPAVEEISPDSLTQKPNFDLASPKIHSWDVGLNQRFLDNRLRFAFDYYHSVLDKEIVVVNDSPVNFDKTERNGYEASVDMNVTENLMFMTAYSWVKARDLNPDTVGGDRITSVPEYVWTNSLRWLKPVSQTKYWVTDLSNQIYGRAPLNPAGSVMQPAITRWQGRITYGFRPWEVFLGGMLIPQRFASDIEIDGGNGSTYYYSWPVWQVTSGVRYSFKI